jgi:hypothetical protein
LLDVTTCKGFIWAKIISTFQQAIYKVCAQLIFVTCFFSIKTVF